MKRLEFRGEWWLPERPEERLRGKLEFDPSTGGLLELEGGLVTRETGPGALQVNSDIIHGQTNMQPITLEGCVGHIRGLFADSNVTRFGINTIYVGQHFRKEQIRFSEVSLSYTRLDDWMAQDKFRYTGSYSITYIPSPPVEAEFESMRISIASEFQQHDHFGREILLCDVARITLKAKSGNDLSFEEYMPYIDVHLRNFLTFATGNSNYPVDIKAEKPGDDWRTEIYYSSPGFVATAGRIAHWDMLFTFDQTRHYLPTLLHKWMSKSEKLQSVYDLYFKLYYQRGLDQTTHFLFLAQALEAYHRNLYGGVYKSEEEYAPNLEQLIQAIKELDTSNDHKNKLRDMVKYGYEYSFRKRIKCILKDLENYLGEHKHILDRIHVSSDQFVLTVKDTRDLLTHHMMKPPEHAIAVDDRKKMHEFSWKMLVLLRICFLKELGFPPNDIKMLLKEDREYKDLARTLRNKLIENRDDQNPLLSLPPLK